MVVDHRRLTFAVENLLDLAVVRSNVLGSGCTDKERKLGEDHGDVLGARAERRLGLLGGVVYRGASGGGGGCFGCGGALWAWAMRRHCGAQIMLQCGMAADLISSLLRSGVRTGGVRRGKGAEKKRNGRAARWTRDDGKRRS